MLVTGLTASVLKVGTTAVIKTESEELKRVTGTFTNDANAVASDIISGKTAYVNGNKVTGNIATRTGTISISNPSISGNNLVTPTIPNGYYNNAKISFNRNNLYPESIKAGTNLYGVVGTFTNDATATAGDIASGKTAYVRGQKITGTLQKSRKLIGTVSFVADRNYVGMTVLSLDGSLLLRNTYQASANNGIRVYFRRSANIYIENWHVNRWDVGSYQEPTVNLNGERIYAQKTYAVNSSSSFYIQGSTQYAIWNWTYLITEVV